MTKRETETQAALPHQLGCFEYYAEETVEQVAECGIELAGDHDEMYCGVAIIDRFHIAMRNGASECRCEVDEEV